MKKPIVLSFDANGKVEFTRTKDITLFGGEGRMQRVTEIQKLDHAPQYYISWLMGPYRDNIHTHVMAFEYMTMAELGKLQAPRINRSEPMYFASYEAAVSHEIDMLNAMRKAGVRFHEAA